MLCEAQNYVKLRVSTSAYPLISAPQLSNSLHIIHGPSLEDSPLAKNGTLLNWLAEGL